MKKTTSATIMTLVLMVFQSVYSQTNVTFLNTGQMNVAAASPSTRVSLYVPDAMRQLGSGVQVIQNGITELGGNFYQDATTNVFEVDATTKTTSTGKFRFVKDRGVNRTITTQSVALNTFDRGLSYIAFPNFEISTNDSIEIPGKMGIDATTLHRVNAKVGKMILRSDVIGTNVFDASLRITQAGTSASLVDLGAVIVERDMTLYRPQNGSTQMFGFATPFKNTQLSGCFAGNWVRRPMNTGTYGHTTYVYGNKDTAPADGTIDDDQYVYIAAEKLVPAQAYLIKPRPKLYGYDNLKATSGLWYTGEPNPSLYDKGKYHFNGSVYTVTPYSEQLFADDVLYSNSISDANLGSTVNWLIGNSYTCPIPTSLLAKAMENSPLQFAPYIYVYPAGATTYQAYDISGSGDAIVVSSVKDIAAMSVFMVRVLKGASQIGSLSIGKDLLRHADVAHNNPLSMKGINNVRNADGATNQIVFNVHPVDNENIFDVTAIGLRASASMGSDNYDMAKAFVNDDNIFQLYTLSSTQAKLSANGLPLTADSIVMAFQPSQYGGNYSLTTKYAETLSTEGVWVYDTKMQKMTDMKAMGSYSFTSDPTDAPNRFLINFKRPIGTGTNNINYKLDLYYNNKSVRIKQLTASDLGSKITLYDMQGKQLRTMKIDNYPEMNIDVKDLVQGVYLIQMKGDRTAISKFVVN
ncbi:MAG: T9SS type A sorting domain-containing protein [Paludibacter sp.]